MEVSLAREGEKSVMSGLKFLSLVMTRLVRVIHVFSWKTRDKPLSTC